MFVCPLCEHQQAQGAVCDVCGKQLGAPPPVPVAPEVMPELESTVRSDGNPSVAVERMPELDIHRAEPTEAPVAAPLPDLERTGLPDLGAPAITPLLEAESTRYASDGQRTALPTVLTCRYCGGQQQTGVLCDRCGNKFPVAFRDTAKPTTSDPTVTCRECGVKAVPGRRCPSCGTFLRVPER